MTAQRKLVQHDRARSGIPVIALVGYTNAGKSALLKAVTHTEEDTDGGGPPLSDDRLFHTLSTAARRAKLPTGSEAIVLDTVGFISDLPHALVAAFQSTLAEVWHTC